MTDDDGMRKGLTAAVAGRRSGAADRLCAACVDMMSVDVAALSLASTGTFYSVGAAGTGIGPIEELQFTTGEGPCVEAVNSFAPVLVADLNDTHRWPAFVDAVPGLGVRAVFALPVMVAGFPIGVLTLCRHRPGPLTGGTATGAFLAAELAVLPLLDVLGTDLRAAVDDMGSPAWDELGAMMRSEVYQATGVLVAQLGVAPGEANGPAPRARLRQWRDHQRCRVPDIGAPPVSRS
jgi:hypothetical protein